jgi:D-alanine--poly(phosphoribitol) ligase subunit 1
MGYRIELEEIELAIYSIPEVNEAAVLYQKSNTIYGKIVAYIA